MKLPGAIRIAAILLMAVPLTLLATCGEWKAPQLKWQPLVSPQNEQPSESDGTGLPSVLELDELVSNTSKGVRQGDQVISTGSDYDPDLSATTSGREEAIEVEDTSLNLRAYEIGEYTYAIIPQLVGDGGWGGGRDDDIPLLSLIATEVCDWGGGRDDDIPLLYYIGFADYTLGSWRWYGPFTATNPEITLNSGDLESRFKSPTDMLYLAVLTTAAGKETSQLPREGLAAALPFEPAVRSASQLEDPVGVRVNLVTTDIDSGIGTLPQIVTGLGATVGGSSITLTWDGNPDPHVTMHQVYRENLTLGTAMEWLADVTMPTLEYEDTTAVGDTTYRYTVLAVNDTGNGGYGEIEVGPPIIKAVAPLYGVEGDTVTFAVTLDGSEPFTYEWNFGGGAEPNTSTNARPTVTLGEVGEYAAWISIDNAYGHDSLDFTLTVNEAPTWLIVTVDSEGDVGLDTCIAEVNGYPAISYYDATNSELKYVRATAIDGSSWGSPTVVDAPEGGTWWNSLAMVNGSPAISYCAEVVGDLKYVRATESYGDSWGTPITVDAHSYVGLYTSLAVVNGNPAISYFDDNDLDLYYVRASDAGGSSWGVPIIVDSAGVVGEFTSLAVINGNPAISYFADTGCDLRYVRANDASGSSWGTPAIVDSAGWVGEYSSLAVVNGSPAISYCGTSGVKYVRASDASGSSWGIPVIIAGTGWEESSSLAVVDGNPAISYFDYINSDLKYVRASDASGSSWGIPVAVDSAGTVGSHTSLAVINGNPAISYYDATNGDLKFATLY